MNSEVAALRKELAGKDRQIEKLQNVSNLIKEDLRDAFEASVKVLKPYKTNSKSKMKRALNILLSDLHFGANLDPRETPMPYGTTEERRAFAAVCREVIEYKTHYRNETELIVHLAGDIIQGRLHDLASAAPVAEQMTRAIHLIGMFLQRMVEHFPKVTVYCTPGNHGRNKSRHHDRAVAQKWDSYETVIYEALRLQFSSNKTIKFHIPKTPFYEYEIFNMRGFVTHGDTVLNPGYPGKAINVGRLESQILKLISGRGEYKLVAVGHVHVPSVTQLPSSVLVTNGCLIPPDEYSMSIGFHDNVRVQQLWETVPGFMFGDHRMVNVDESTHFDTSLDEVIPPDAN